MSTQLNTIQTFLEGGEIKQKFEKLLNERAGIFLTTVLHVISQNDQLANASKESVYLSALASATLGLSIDPNFGQAYIIPYQKKKKVNGNRVDDGPSTAQLQIGYKGYETLAIRSQQYKHLQARVVYEGQLIEDDSFMGYHFDWKSKTSDKEIGFASYFCLKSGFEDTLYMSTEEVTKHAKQYSQTFKKYGTGLRSDDYIKMGLKTVIKLHLNSGKAPLDPLMELAIKADQGVAKDESLNGFDYDDNPDEQPAALVINQIDPDLMDYRVANLANCETVKQVEEMRQQNKPTDPQILALFTQRKNDLNNTKI